jgi:TnpA family transposase
LDYLVENDSDVWPDSIHADTQGQSAAIFGLAHLLGIQLQPRILNWRGASLLSLHAGTAMRTHRSPVFEDDRLESHRDHAAGDAAGGAVSIGAGRIKPLTVVRRLATYSRRSKLYFAFRELGHAAVQASTRISL